MAASLDFRVAKEDGSVSWLETSDHYDQGVLAESADDFTNTIGCFVMGSRTYELALKLGWPYGDVPAIVLTHRDLAANRPSVEFYSGDLSRLINDVLKPRYENIWLVGGPMLARDFVRLNLVDDIRISLVPVLLGEGAPFVDHIGGERALHLKDVTAYKNGIVELWYEFKK
jgi:dihydrofolate reductase